MASLIHNRRKQYRRRAEEARTKADAMTDPARRRQLHQVAETWERMARWEEEHPVFGGLLGAVPENRREGDPS